MATIISLLGKDKTRDTVISAQNVLKNMNRAEDHISYLEASIEEYRETHIPVENLAFLAAIQAHVFTKAEHPYACPTDTKLLVDKIGCIELDTK